MTAQTTHDPLDGLTIDELQLQVLRRTMRAEEIMRHLERYAYAEGNMVGRALRAELETCLDEARVLETRLIELRARTRDRDTRFNAFHHAYRSQHG